MEESPLDYQGVELLVTEHWDARCLNNGLFYVRASYRTLIFFNLFLRQIYINPYTDNQNLFDAFLSHSTLDTAVPDSRPLLRYALLDIDRQFGCAEGHAAEDSLVTFHFWASDFRTREAAETERGGGSENAAGRIVARDGVERVEKVRAKKDELFEIFFSETAQEEYSRGLLGVPSAGADFIAQVRAPQPDWRGMCSVTAVGVEDLVDERLLQGENQLIDWKAATNVMGADSEEREAAKDGDCEAKPRCEGIPLDEWALALQAIAQLEGGEGLSLAEVVVLKQRIRSLDVGTLLTVRAFNRYGPSRLAKELKELLEAEG